MESFQSREEIRRRVQARCGHVTGDGQAPLIEEQFNEFIRAAAMEVYTRCQWARSQRETRVDIGIDQRFVNYPDNAGPENIIAAAIWDEGSTCYIPLTRRPITLPLDDEPLVDAGGDPAEAARARPLYYECKDQIELWPRADQAYEIKFDHTVNPELDDDDTESVVDAECIILWAMADVYDFQGDTELAEVQRSKFQSRIDKLIRWQSNLPRVKMGAGNRAYANKNRYQTDGYVPNSGVWPSTMPS